MSYTWSGPTQDLQPKYHLPSDLAKSLMHCLSITWKKCCSVITSRWATWEDTSYSIHSFSHLVNEVFSPDPLSLYLCSMIQAVQELNKKTVSCCVRSSPGWLKTMSTCLTSAHLYVDLTNPCKYVPKIFPKPAEGIRWNSILFHLLRPSAISFLAFSGSPAPDLAPRTLPPTSSYALLYQTHYSRESGS